MIRQRSSHQVPGASKPYAPEERHRRCAEAGAQTWRTQLATTRHALRVNTRFLKASRTILSNWSRIAGLLLLVVTMTATAAAAQDTGIPDTDQEWAQLWGRVNTDSYYLRRFGRATGAAIIAKAVRTRPNGYQWAALGGMVCAVDGRTRVALRGDSRVAEFDAARLCLETIVAALPDAGSSVEHSYVRSILSRHLAESYVEAGMLAAADSLAAIELERAAREGAPDIGNVIYDMNQVRGRVALSRGRRADALQFLRASAATSGSPQLASWGPRLTLARELLAVGETEPVLEFLSQLRSIWRGPVAAEALSEAVAAIRNGDIPDGAQWR